MDINVDINDITQLQADGNALYSSGRYDDARTCYSAAIALLEDVLGEAATRSSVNASTAPTAAASFTDASTTLTDAAAAALTASQLFSNRAQTHIQERNFAAALHDCAKALKYNANNDKATVRRLVALENLERFEAALAVVDTVLEQQRSTSHASSSPALFQYAVAARRRLRKMLVRDHAAAVNEAAQIGKMVHDHQQLRINFGSLVPAHVQLNTFVDVVVYIGNEFGLFRRSAIPATERIYLQCRLRVHDDAPTTSNHLTLAFHAASDDEDDDKQTDKSVAAVRSDGRLTLNDRGKVAFRVAVTTADNTNSSLRKHSNSDTLLHVRAALHVTVHADSRAAWSLFPVVSLPFDVVQATERSPQALLRTPDASSATATAATNDVLGVHCCRPVAVAGIDREILLAESPGNLGIGGKLWDSCLVLTRYLALHRDLITHKSVVELGSGLGLVGICCALLGSASVTLTDMEDVVPLLDYNIALNFPSSTDSKSDSTSDSDNMSTSDNEVTLQPVVPTAAAHCWGTSTAALPVPQPDVLVLSDVVYDPDGYAPLVASLNALAHQDTVVLMAHRSRNPMEHQFFALLAQTFAFELVDWASCFAEATTIAAADSHEQPQSALLPSPSSTNEQVLQDVKIFRMQRL